MDRDDFDGAEVDRLLQELKSPPRAPKPKPAVVAPATPAGGTAAPAPTAPAAPRVPAPGRWTTARLLMPAATASKPRKTFALASAMHFPTWPRLGVPALTEAQWAVFTARLFVGLGVVLSAVMPYWPYANACSWGLGLYLSAVLLVVVTGLWAAKLTWESRLGAAHALALCVVFWGLTLAAGMVLPRVGYALVQEAWFCS